jgi:hypothetical protein
VKKRVDLSRISRFSSRGRSIYPVLALACEGETEMKYAFSFSAGYSIRVKPKLYRGIRDHELIDRALEHSRLMQNKYDGAEIISSAIYDLEGFANVDIKRALDVIQYSADKNVKVWINIPLMERWFLLHFKHFGMTRSGKSAERELKNTLSRDSSLKNYKKPGSVGFYKMLDLRVETAMANCATGSHSKFSADHCMCNFVKFIREFV